MHLPGMERYKSLNEAVLSPNQWPPWRPALGNVEREITTLRFPRIFSSALFDKYNKKMNVKAQKDHGSAEVRSVSGTGGKLIQFSGRSGYEKSLK